MNKKIITIMSSTLVVCSLIAATLAINTEEVYANKIELKLNSLVKYVIPQAKNTDSNSSSKVAILHKLKSKNEVTEFASLADAKLSKLSDINIDHSFIATVTMKKALSLDDFENFVRQYNLDICDYKIRTIDKYGTRITINSTPNNGQLIDRDIINDCIGENKFVGVIAFTNNVTENNFEKIIEMKNDERVFVIDTDSYFVGKDYKEQSNKNIVKVKSNDIYWYLEDYKLNS